MRILDQIFTADALSNTTSYQQWPQPVIQSPAHKAAICQIQQHVCCKYNI